MSKVDICSSSNLITADYTLQAYFSEKIKQNLSFKGSAEVSFSVFVTLSK